MAWGEEEYVPLSQYRQLERRVGQVEQTLRQQEATIRILQARLDTQPGALAHRPVAPTPPPFLPPPPMAGGGYPGSQWGSASARHDRSRTPVGSRASGGSSDVHSFASENGVDSKCMDALLSATPECQEYVISRGPASGRNPSAMIMGRIKKWEDEHEGAAQVSNHQASSYDEADEGGLVQQVEDFIVESLVDEKCADTLRQQTYEVQAAVLNQGPVEGRNPSAMVMGRIATAARVGVAGGGGGQRQGVSSVDAQQLEDFIEQSGLDEKSAASLRGQPPTIQAAVLRKGPADGRNPSAMVMGRIAKAARGEL